MKKLVSVIMICTVVFASEPLSKVDISKGVLQLGVFKNIQNIKRLQATFKDLNFYVKPFHDGIKKAYIVNIKRDDINSTMTKVRKVIPNAFLLNHQAKMKVFKNLSPCKAQLGKLQKPKKISTQKSILFENSSCLDSKAIIKARKKFFK